MTEWKAADDMNGRVIQLIDLLNLRASGDLRFTGSRQPGGTGRVFGGQVVAQAVVAAMRTVPADRILHSLHCYFMRGGNEDYEIDYHVHADFDGGSFSTRRVVALQQGQPILTMTASFHRPEPGFSHQSPMPDVPPPEDLPSEIDRIEADVSPHTAAALTRFLRMRPLDVRPISSRFSDEGHRQAPARQSWVKLGAMLGAFPEAKSFPGGEANLHRAILAYASDLLLLGTSIIPHGMTSANPGFKAASLDHALWLHDDFRIDDWLLYATDSPWAGHARGFSRGRFYARDGRLVASVAQEGLIRYRQPG